MGNLKGFLGKKELGVPIWIWAIIVAFIVLLVYRHYKNKQAATDNTAANLLPASATDSTGGSPIIDPGSIPGITDPGGNNPGGTPGPSDGGGGGNPTGSWIFLINPSLCGNGDTGCYLYRVAANADGTCPAGSNPNPFHPGSGFCFFYSDPNGTPAPGPTSQNDTAQQGNAAAAASNGAITQGQTTGITQKITLGGNNGISNPIPPRKALTVGGKGLISRITGNNKKTAAPLQRAVITGPNKRPRNWFGPPPKAKAKRQHYEGPPVKEPTGDNDLPSPQA